jgi:hypothetical protein
MWDYVELGNVMEVSNVMILASILGSIVVLEACRF